MPSEEQGKVKAMMNNQRGRINILHIPDSLGCCHVLQYKQIKALTMCFHKIQCIPHELRNVKMKGIFLQLGKRTERAGLLSNSLVWIQYYCLHSFSGHKMFIINFVFEAVNLLALPPPVYSQQSHWGSTVSDSTSYAWLRGLHIPPNYFQRNKAIKFLILSLKHVSNLFTMRPPWMNRVETLYEIMILSPFCPGHAVLTIARGPIMWRLWAKLDETRGTYKETGCHFGAQVLVLLHQAQGLFFL